MKNRFYIIIMCIAALIMFNACNHDQAQSQDVVPEYTVEDVEGSTADEVKKIMHYSSVDTRGQKITLSGYFSYAQGDNCQLKQIILCVHGTYQLNALAPSVRKNGEDIPKNAAQGRVIICPDYLGYGDTKDKVHPYMNQSLTARNSLDMELAVLQYFRDNNIELSEDYYTIIAGFSQGGSSALATHKYVESLPERQQNNIRLRKSFCGGTPASMEVTMNEFLEKETGIEIPKKQEEMQKILEGVSLEVVISFMAIQGMYESYPEAFKSYELKDFYNPLIDVNKLSEALKVGTDEDSEVKEVWELYEESNKKIIEAVTLFSAYVFMNPEKVMVCDIYSEDFLDDNSNLRNKFMGCLRKNDLTGWEPKNPIDFYHSTKDDVVPYANLEALMAADKMGRFPQKVHAYTEADFENVDDENLTHGNFGMNVFFPHVLNILDNMD